MPSALKRAEEILLGFERKIKPKNGGGPGRTQKARPAYLKQNTGLTNLKNAGLKRTEVVVKIPTRKSSKVSKFAAVKNHLDYISRNGKISIETKDGRTLTGHGTGKNLLQEWYQSGVVDKSSTLKQHLNIVLSMPSGTPPEAVKNAAKAFAKELFENHEWVLALHTDTDDPHVHLCVSMMGIDGKRLNPRKNDLFNYRLLFAQKMREQGVDCCATKRTHRGQFLKSDNSIINHINKRGGYSTIQHAKLTALKEAIKNNRKPIHHFLQETLNSQQLRNDDYKLLAKQLYQEGYKTEARAVSMLAKTAQHNTKNIQTQAQKDFNLLKQGYMPKKYHLYDLLDKIRTHKGDLTDFLQHHANELDKNTCNTLAKQLYKEGHKTAAHQLSNFAKNIQSDRGDLTR